MVFALKHYNFYSNNLRAYLFSDAFITFVTPLTLCFLFYHDKDQTKTNIKLFRLLFFAAVLMGPVGIIVLKEIEKYASTRGVYYYIIARIGWHCIFDLLFLYQFVSA